VEWTLFIVWLVGKKVAVGATSSAASSTSDTWTKAVDFGTECWEFVWDNYVEVSFFVFPYGQLD
jgi:hypothetical protein